MRIIYKISHCHVFLCATFMGLFLFSCTDNFMEINMDKTQLMQVGPKEYAELFTHALHKGIAWCTTDDMSRMSSTLALHNCGYIACGKAANDQYQQGLGWQNAGFKDIFVDAIPTINLILESAKREGFTTAYNVALIWRCYQFLLATDVWGPIPYKEAGSGKESVRYESQKDVYYGLFEELTSAVNTLMPQIQANPNLNVFGTGDPIYSGSVIKWVKFANTLRLRMALRISNVDPTKAKTEAEAAIATGLLLENNNDNAMFEVKNFAEEGNGMPRMESFYQDVMSTSMESIMKGYQDPRMQEFWSPVQSSPTNQRFPDEYKSNIGGYHGFPSGADPVEYTYFRAFSKYGPRFVDGNQLVTPINIMHSSEVCFLKAEGAWRGWNMGGTAKEFYEKGIVLSIKQWRGTEITDDSIQRYINSTLMPVAPENYPYYDPPMTDIPVKFSDDREKQYEQILTQKWLALFPLGFEAWAEFRRTRLPKLYPKKYSVNGNIDLSKGMIQTRCPFVEDEYSANATEIQKAIQLIGGTDLETIPMWWDTYPNGN